MELNNFSITVLAEDTVNQRGIIGEHGLCFCIDSPQGQVLFDTGQGLVLSQNSAKLNIPLEQAKAVVLSHGHYDHSGGLFYILEKNSHARIFLHPDALTIRYNKPKDSSAREIGMPLQIKEYLKQMENRIVWTESPTCLMDGVHATGYIPRKTLYEDVGGDFFLDEECRHPDPINDDQSLWLETNRGIVILLGCAHSGVVNILNYIAEITGKKEFFAVLGGMHLGRASSERLNATLEAFLNYRVQVIAPAHCTGNIASYFLRQYLQSKFAVCITGSKFIF